MSQNIRVEADSFQLQPGDMMFWYTSGLLKTLNPQGETLNSDRVFELLSELYDQYDGQAMKITQEIVEKLKRSLAIYPRSLEKILR